jgi:hypothetical protein
MKFLLHRRTSAPYTIRQSGEKKFRALTNERLAYIYQWFTKNADNGDKKDESQP